MSDEFNSQYCNVNYIEKDNVVYLEWKNFCKLDDYRKPTLFASNLLKKHKNANYVVNAKNGFEDDERDVVWGFNTLLPDMAKSDCKICVFIMNEISTIDGEIDMWTKEFMKYFTVKKALTYNEAIQFIKHSNT